ncbi:hypothetical protein EIP86_005464 [Pleurotus ostreatoroseus]|nr:hypothetical protein EIP86_005464 [Pleurotus ostreatoroseus]
MEHDSAAASARQVNLCDAILRQHLDRVVIKHPNSAADLASGLTYLDAINLSGGGLHEGLQGERQNDGRRTAGGLSETDLRRFGLDRPRTLSESNSHHTDDEEHDYLDLTGQLREQQARVEAANVQIVNARQRIGDTVQQINEIHPRLHSKLLQAIASLPHLINTQRAVEFEELAMTLETCLLKLSLIRARTHESVYGYSSTNRADATMEKALGALQEKLAEKRRQQDKEERELDERIGQYDAVLHVIDGGGLNFTQVVDDMARVRRESEECRRDLRRLGWTG